MYDLLPKELQLPSSTQQNPAAAMSQKSGGEAVPPPSAALDSGKPLLLYPLFSSASMVTVSSAGNGSILFPGVNPSLGYLQDHFQLH